MKKIVLLFWALLYSVIVLSGNVHATKSKLAKNSFAGQIQVRGMDPMGAPFTNGQTNVSEPDGTLFFDTATGAESFTSFTIENISFTDDLNISSVTITGADASDFQVDAMLPVTVNLGMMEQIMIKFNPQSAGTKNATVTIVSDDATNGTFTFAIQGTAFESGTGLDFDGVDDNITFDNGNYSLNGNFSLELWIKPDISGTGEHTILDNQSSNSGYSLRIDTSMQLNFSFFTASGINTLTSAPIINDQWQHLVIVCNGTRYIMYIDGVLDTSLELSDTIVDTSSNNLAIGVTSGGGAYYKGIIDELRVWETEISSCRITNQFSCELVGDEDNLLAYYNFNNGEVNGNNFPMFDVLRYNHTISSGIPPEGRLNNFGLTGTASNWIDATANGVTGTCATYTEPLIGITSNSNTITNGSTDTVTPNNTSFGNVVLGQAEPEDYTISNTGNGVLNISNIVIDGSTDFTIIESPATVAAGGSGNLRILFTPSSNATKNATVGITNDDCDDATFEFDIEGTGFTPATGLDFDGVDDHISVNHNSSFNTNTFTIETYFKTSSTTAGQSILAKYDATGINGFSMYLSSSGVLRFEYAVPNSETTSLSNASGLNDGNWHHVALAFGNGKLTFYIDGVLDNEITFSNVPETPTNTESLSIGYSEFNTVYFNGEIDEVRYWSRVLCLDEINAQRGCELAGNESGLVAYYNLNQGKINTSNSTETTANDETSNNLDGTLTNFDLTGSTSNWIDTSANSISGTCSVAIPEISVQGELIDIPSGDDTPNTSDNTDAGTVVVGNSKDMTFFVVNTDGTGNLLVDSVTLSGDTSDFTLTQNPSNNPILPGQGATLRFSFNPTSGGTKTAIVTVNSNDCDEPVYTFTIQGYGAGQGTGLDFDGTDDFITVPHNVSQNNLNFSVDFWIKTTDGNGAIINKFTPDGNNGWRINLDGGRIEFYYYASASNYTTRLLNGATYVADGNWHHVAITLDSGRARCYIDGASAHSTGWNGTATVASSSEDIQIGYAASDTPTGDAAGYFQGQLDELRVWTKTLTAFEVGARNSCSADMAQADLLLSYNFNQGITEQNNSSETTLNDSSGNNTNGTLSNFELDGSTSNWIDTTANGISGSCDCVVVGDVTLTSQTEVDNYVTNTLGSCGIIEGDLTINGTITDLSGFSNVHIISGDFYMEGNIVDDLSGFSALTTVGGNFTLKNMANTSSIASFSNVTSIGGSFEVNNLDQITDISILSQISSISSITITGNSMLSTIAFDELQTMGSKISITFNSSLSSFSVPKLTQVNGEFAINNNGGGITSLSLALLESTGNFLIADMNGLQSISVPELHTLTGRLSVAGCNALTTLSIPKLTSVSNNFSIDSCTQLATIDIMALSTVSGNFSIDDLAISSLSFLQNVTSIGGQLLIRDMVNLTNLQGVDELTSLGSFSLNDCDLVTNLEGFPKLAITSINSLTISENELITSFNNSFLESLTSIGRLSISFNGSLADISALQNVTQLTSSDSTIRNNNELLTIDLFGLQNVANNLVIQNQANTTGLCGLFNYVHNGNGSSTLTFTGTNPTDWDSVQDIIDGCGTPVITLIGDNPQEIELGSGYSELGATVNDGSTVIINTSAFVDAIGSYDITYNATGVSGNNAVEVIRTVNVVHPAEITWNGNTDTNWTVNGNWSTSFTPLVTQNVIVPDVTNQPIIGSGVVAEMNNLTVESLASFDISDGGVVLVNGNLTANETINIGSSVNTSGTFIVKGTATGNVSYERSGLTANAWSLITAPVSGQSIKEFIENSANDIRVNTTVTPNRYAVAYYNDSNAAGSKWVYYTADDIVTNTLTFEKGKSYIVSRATNGSVTFTGTLETNDVSVSVNEDQWNAVGSPYTAYLPVNNNANANFIQENLSKFDPVNVGVYVWDNSQNKYVAKTLLDSDISLTVGQGFFIKTASGVTSIDFKENQRLHNATGVQVFSRGTTTAIPSIQVLAEQDGVVVDTNIKYLANATKELDSGYDVGNFKGASFDIFTRLVGNSEESNFTIQALPNTGYEEMVIPLGIQSEANKTIQLSVASEALPSGTKIYLEDTTTGNFIELRKNKAYTFQTSEVLSGIGRFYIHTKFNPIEKEDFYNVDIFKSNKQEITITGIQSQGEVEIQLYSVLGSKVYSQSVKGSNTIIIQPVSSFGAGIYIVRLELEGKTIHKKVIFE
ncbi:LamG-like jellyroll fold domain-containing protein [Tenacibaculum agarivorans]|uniref:LamG-like jellyroll fold domain-containing protein n=1 Tax=Tenacibaculum agarivorans TaxID=1908389 RepID=UPI00094B7EC4|nr:LamG-like jellyroll fold domain-containing protein [Tenacibaculum agarivorans]